MIGPLITASAVRNVEELIDDARSKGASVIAGGDTRALGDNFMAPTLICKATPDMRVFSEEIFGPVAPIFSFRSEAEAIQLANATPYGLAAYFYSQDIGQIWRVSDRIEAGMVGVNDAALSSETIPFGGVKESARAVKAQNTASTTTSKSNMSNWEALAHEHRR